MDDKYVIEEVVLKNNCPECFNTEGLRLLFKQKFIENKFYKSMTSNVKQHIECRICNTIIYPVRWTDDIERVVEYHNKAFSPEKASTRLKKLSWIIIVLLVLGTIASIYMFYNNKL